MAISARKEVEFRSRSERNMWIVIITIFIVDTYQLFYSLALVFAGDPNTCFITRSSAVHSFSTFTERSLQYVWWIYPVIWLFWPQELRCRCCKRVDVMTRANLSTLSQSKSINSHMTHDDDYSDNEEFQGLNKNKDVQTFIKKFNYGEVPPNPMPFIVSNQTDRGHMS